MLNKNYSLQIANFSIINFSNEMADNALEEMNKLLIDKNKNISTLMKKYEVEDEINLEQLIEKINRLSKIEIKETSSFSFTPWNIIKSTFNWFKDTMKLIIDIVLSVILSIVIAFLLIYGIKLIRLICNIMKSLRKTLTPENPI
jgi:predicted PurR-regulated permease PerM